MLKFNWFKKREKPKTWTYEHHNVCKELWSKPQVNWDGMLLGCCVNANKNFGINVFETGLERAVSSDLYVYTKKMLQGKVPGIEASPCFHCYLYQQMVKNNDYFTEEEIQELLDNKNKCF